MLWLFSFTSFSFFVRFHFLWGSNGVLRVLFMVFFSLFWLMGSNWLGDCCQ